MADERVVHAPFRIDRLCPCRQSDGGGCSRHDDHPGTDECRHPSARAHKVFARKPEETTEDLPTCRLDAFSSPRPYWHSCPFPPSRRGCSRRHPLIPRLRRPRRNPPPPAPRPIPPPPSPPSTP